MSNFTEDSPQLSMISETLIPEQADDMSAEMAALESRVLRAVEMVKKERSLRVAAENKLAELETRSLKDVGRVPALEAELSVLRQERNQVRQRVERLLRHLDDFNT